MHNNIGRGPLENIAGSARTAQAPRPALQLGGRVARVQRLTTGSQSIVARRRVSCVTWACFLFQTLKLAACLKPRILVAGKRPERPLYRLRVVLSSLEFDSVDWTGCLGPVALTADAMATLALGLTQNGTTVVNSSPLYRAEPVTVSSLRYDSHSAIPIPPHARSREFGTGARLHRLHSCRAKLPA
jgi:hypothetical protein